MGNQSGKRVAGAGLQTTSATGNDDAAPVNQAAGSEVAPACSGVRVGAGAGS